MRMRRLLVLLLIFALLAPALPVKAESTYYALSFDGEDDYIEQIDFGNATSSEITVCAIVEPFSAGKRADNIIGSETYWAKSGGWWLYRNNNVPGRFRFRIYDDNEIQNEVNSVTIIEANRTYFVCARYGGGELALFIDGNKEASVTGIALSSVKYGEVIISYPPTGTRPFYGNIYSILIYSRALSDSEIQQIYENPENPPLDGLVLFYAPDSVDTANGLWKDLSGHGNDGTIYGATAERVSIPDVHYYDIENNSEIDVSTVSVEMLSENSTISLIPSFLVLPYNANVTLNVSAVNYLHTITTFQTPTDVLNIFLVPNHTTTTKVGSIDLSNATVPEFQPPENVTKLYGIFGKWIGGDKIVYLFKFDTKGFLEDFLNNPPLPGLGIIFVLVIWAGSVLATYAYFRQPEPTLLIGSAVYAGFSEFIDVNPAMLYGPLGMFSVYLGYQVALKIMKKLGGGSE